jgi:hypothetical protein
MIGRRQREEMRRDDGIAASRRRLVAVIGKT